MKNILIVLLSLTLGAVLTLAATQAGPFPGEARATNNVEITENIRLYSDGTLVGEWTGIGKGRMDGNTYIFKTKRGQFSRIWRIRGDFVIERQPN